MSRVVADIAQQVMAMQHSWEQKRIKQLRRRGRRVNIWGVWEPQASFEYALMLGSLSTETYLKLMEWQAQTAQRRLEETGKLTVIIQDNASVHRSLLTQQQWERWQQQGLLLFFLPPYSPQMNRIEDEWLHLKRDELNSQVFADEYDLAIAITDGLETRAMRGQYAEESVFGLIRWSYLFRRNHLLLGVWDQHRLHILATISDGEAS